MEIMLIQQLVLTQIIIRFSDFFFFLLLSSFLSLREIYFPACSEDQLGDYSLNSKQCVHLIHI